MFILLLTTFFLLYLHRGYDKIAAQRYEIIIKIGIK